MEKAQKEKPSKAQETKIVELQQELLKAKSDLNQLQQEYATATFTLNSLTSLQKSITEQTDATSLVNSFQEMFNSLNGIGTGDFQKDIDDLSQKLNTITDSSLKQSATALTGLLTRLKSFLSTRELSTTIEAQNNLKLMEEKEELDEKVKNQNKEIELLKAQIELKEDIIKKNELSLSNNEFTIKFLQGELKTLTEV